jgi:PhzF family phenazine biosynthesis protein
MKARAFKQIDVFTRQAYFGNALAVVLDGSDLDDAAMQRFAAWTNLSETTFVLPPTEGSADYRVRIFTPGGELPFAGHPTLGSCHAWLQAGGLPKDPNAIVQQCQVGLVQIRREGTRLAFAAPALKSYAPSAEQLAQVTAALGLTAHNILAAQWLDNGPIWLGLLLDSADSVIHLEADHATLKKLGFKVGVIAAHEVQAGSALIGRSNREARAFSGSTKTFSPDPADFEVRAFAAPVGIDEDPVTGSLNASLAQWLMAEGHAPASYVAAQGQRLGRAGRVYLSREPAEGAIGQLWVGGESVTCIDGSVTL